MQVFLIGALAVSLVAVLFGVQNTGPVSVAFLGWTFEGSLALVLFVAFVAGALASFLASVPSMVKGRWTSGQRRKELFALQTDLADCRRRLRDAEDRMGTPVADAMKEPLLELDAPPDS